ncbi:hypothetical protein ANTHELSMS3_04667 (plasmid) [Antarctobacter heliothermus]|uniref:Sulfotransferase family protein n=1 Tax=Antarctobacter heliothermus TaxID=74033 RepID=A0A222EBK4_9RHOB|nr:hypothetical protein [Antarctobacter heliothermus]ASP23565.1 hypothetical protein ANTHELSMS3_04667 [Antarctobacter heliothermus]
MSDSPAIILHVGAPTCGTRALQRALSAAPLLTTDSGTLAYTVPRPRGGAVLSGRALRTAAARDVRGRLGWPDPEGAETGLFEQIDRVRRKPPGGVPLASNPGWIGQADRFAEALPQWFTEDSPPVEICAFARPPLDWLNAAYWEWGVWSGRGFGAWLAQMGMPYTLGAALSRWAALPGTDLKLGLTDDVLTAFEGAYGTTLPRPARGTDGALPPALLGFLLRNRRYRADATDIAAEEVFRRWCHVEDAPRPWAVLPRHLSALREATGGDLDRLFALIPEAEAESLRARDPRWTVSADPYETLFLRGRAPLDDPEELAQLYRALVRGVGTVAEAAGKPVPPLQPVLATRASVHTWDVAVARALEHLVLLDTAQRRGRRVFGL